jgi:hypothetical protein
MQCKTDLKARVFGLSSTILGLLSHDIYGKAWYTVVLYCPVIERSPGFLSFRTQDLKA